jgi:hypothetical protein
MRQGLLKKLVVATTLFLATAVAYPTIAGQTPKPSGSPTTKPASTKYKGKVTAFSKTSLAIKLENGKTKTFAITAKQAGQLHLKNGQVVTVVAQGDKAVKVSTTK